MRLQTCRRDPDDAMSSVFIVVENDWIEVEFVDGEFKIKAYPETKVVVELLTIRQLLQRQGR